MGYMFIQGLEVSKLPCESMLRGPPAPLPSKDKLHTVGAERINPHELQAQQFGSRGTNTSIVNKKIFLRLVFWLVVTVNPLSS